jgi:transposase
MPQCTTDKPGFYRGKHATAYVEQVQALKRAKQLLLTLVDAVEAEKALRSWVRRRGTTSSWQSSIVGRKTTRPQVEVFVPLEQAACEKPSAPALPASRQLVWLLLHPDQRLDDAAKELRARLFQVPEMAQAHQLAQQFQDMVRDRTPEALTSWLEACHSSGISELVTFAEGLQREEPVIRAAIELPYSNGVAEGQVNRLKMVKRTAFGRASFELLRRRVLAAA